MQLHTTDLAYRKPVISHGAEHFLVFSFMLDDNESSGTQVTWKIHFAVETPLRHCSEKCENTSELCYTRLYQEVLDGCSCHMCFSFQTRNVTTTVLSLSMTRPCPLRGSCGRFEFQILSPWDSFMKTAHIVSIFQHENLASLFLITVQHPLAKLSRTFIVNVPHI